MNKKLHFLYYILMSFPGLVSLRELWQYINQLSGSDFSFWGLFPMLFIGFVSLCVFLGYKSRIRDIMRREEVENIRERV